MHKILVIDDDLKRNKKLVEALETSFNTLEVHSASSTNEARKLLTNNFYFSIFLDMALPLRKGEKQIDENAGIKLLESISRGRFNKIPNRIIGFTALLDNFKDKEGLFDALGFKLYESKSGDYSWLENALSQVEYALNSLESYNELPTDLAVLSVHGIETDGKWQELLHKEISKKYNNIEISNLQFKFEKYPFTRFMLPYFRTKMVDKFHDELMNWLEENNTKRIVCFAHSFGTYILIKAIEKIKDKSKLENLDLVVLSGSVLKQNYNFENIKKLPNIRIVNDCAKQDGALLLSKGAIWGTGMGGRLGFNALMDDKFVNRSYDGGHSVFFENGNSIVDHYWIPLLEQDADLEPFNKTNLNRKRDNIYEYLARLSSKIKLIYYSVLFSFPIILFVFLLSSHIVW